MKRIVYLLIVVAFIGCKGNENKKAESTPADSTKTQKVASEYTCPMHPEIISDKPGQCPKCGMDLEIKT